MERSGKREKEKSKSFRFRIQNLLQIEALGLKVLVNSLRLLSLHLIATPQWILGPSQELPLSS